MSFFSSRRGAQPSFPSRCANRSFSRKAEIVDGLVLMIAGTLLPAWLLGHLFLSFYPAPESATDPTNTVASESMAIRMPAKAKFQVLKVKQAKVDLLSPIRTVQKR